MSAGTMENSNWFEITNSAHAIEIAWNAGPSSTFELYVDGVLVGQLTGLNTSGYTIETVRLGPSQGLISASAGTQYFDAFVSSRFSIIGP